MAGRSVRESAPQQENACTSTRQVAMSCQAAGWELISNGRSYDTNNGGPSRGALCSRPATLPIAAFPGVPGCSRLPWHNPRPRRWQSRGAEHVDVVGAASAPAESTQDPAAGAHDQQALIVHLTIRWCIHRINVAGQRHACQAAGDWYGGWITLPCNSGPPLWL